MEKKKPFHKDQVGTGKSRKNSQIEETTVFWNGYIGRVILYLVTVIYLNNIYGYLVTLTCPVTAACDGAGPSMHAVCAAHIPCAG